MCCKSEMLFGFGLALGSLELRKIYQEFNRFGETKMRHKRRTSVIILLEKIVFFLECISH